MIRPTPDPIITHLALKFAIKYCEERLNTDPLFKICYETNIKQFKREKKKLQPYIDFLDNLEIK